MYAPELVILPTVTLEAERIPKNDKRQEHLKWIWYHFPEAQLGHEAKRIDERTQELLAHHPEKDVDDCRIVAEAETSSVDVLATIDRRIRRLQHGTAVRLLAPAGALEHLGVTSCSHPHRQPGSGHPLAGATWWRL